MIFCSGYLVGSLLVLSSVVSACSRVTYHAKVDERITIGRSMDFVASTNASIYIFPAGIERNGSVEVNPLQWTSKYGSMVATMYDKVTIDGINAAGLTGSILYLGSSDYGTRNTSRPGLAIGVWLQYYLDMYDTVAGVVADLNSTNLQVVTAALVPGVSSVGHIALTDKSGDNLIIEYLNGQLVIHHGEQYQVMTNDPTFDEQLAIWEYWKPMSNYSLPGTGTPADRFVRLSYYNTITADAPGLMSSVATTAAMIRAVSVPFVPESEINTGLDLWPTLWRCYYDLKDMVFFYESSVTPIAIFMYLEDYDLSKNGTVKRLALADTDWQGLYGDMKGNFTDAKIFQPI
ncbi:hypothetical protein, variant [Exophiala mesophila]|uniref:Choloylglycine hydrolase/NAAA C-terminal domain-containing protein n=1 Tax=Exophiala mesophila TaxID=212818 RepID=A0A0D1ZU91_EXOME|nr:uncharacterized protein PV10_01784 [Exophiala mesophila]XP_016229672.1 hypothetical protein, variant [Exophiala mesophila]KIV98097.1 hypothetical protein PV10_01784 [Exophiala mesophila]KIV98098.1 hypothetical protein, variant [Exophiala mesophila]